MGNIVSIDITAVDNASNVLNNIAGGFSMLGDAAKAGIEMAAGAFQSLLQAGSETQDTMARFNSLVDSSPLAGYKDEMLDLADAIAKKTRFDNDSILATEAQLAIYTNISEKVFPDALKATINMASYMEGDAQAAAKLFGRSLEDIGNGSLNLLYRQKLITEETKNTAEAMISSSGSSAAYKYELDNVSDAVREQALELQKNGKFAEAYKVIWDGLGDAQKVMAQKIRETDGEAEAQQYIIDALNGKIGNLAEDMGKTFPGQVEILKNKLNDFWQGQGNATEEVLKPLIADFNTLADQALPYVKIGLDKMNEALAPVVDTFHKLVAGDISVSDLFDGIKVSLSNINWGKIALDTVHGFEQVDWGGMFKSAIDGLGFAAEIGSNIFDGIDFGVKEIDWSKLSADIEKTLVDADFKGLGEKFHDLGVSAGTAFGDGIKGAVEGIDWVDVLGAASLAFSRFEGGLVGVDFDKLVLEDLPRMETVLSGFFDVLPMMIQGQLAQIPDTISKAVSSWAGVLQTKGAEMGKAAQGMMDNVKGAIDSKIKDVSKSFEPLKKGWDDAMSDMEKAVSPVTKAIQLAIDKVNELISLVQTAIETVAKLVIPGAGTGTGEGHSSGADFIVPPGYPNDSYPMRVESGEHVVVTPANKVSSSKPSYQSSEQGTPPPQSGTVLQNHGTINIYLNGDKMTVANFMDELGAAM
jgi:hypothetical protein